MKRLKDIQINRFQLNALLNDEQMQGYNYLLQHGVYCTTCNDNCAKGVEVRAIYLTSLNDIKIEGTCKNCNGSVARIMEFGEDREFFERAMKYRKTISN